MQGVGVDRIPAFKRTFKVQCWPVIGLIQHQSHHVRVPVGWVDVERSIRINRLLPRHVGICLDIHHNKAYALVSISEEGVTMRQVAKLFINGRSQAVRLPVAFRFDTKEVFIRQDPETGDVILSRRPTTWDDFFSALKDADVPADFLNENERGQKAQNRDPFEEWRE